MRRPSLPVLPLPERWAGQGGASHSPLPRYVQFCRDVGRDVNALTDDPTPLLCEHAILTARRRNFTVAKAMPESISMKVRQSDSRGQPSHEAQELRFDLGAGPPPRQTEARLGEEG